MARKLENKFYKNRGQIRGLILTAHPGQAIILTGTERREIPNAVVQKRVLQSAVVLTAGAAKRRGTQCRVLQSAVALNAVCSKGAVLHAVCCKAPWY